MSSASHLKCVIVFPFGLSLSLVCWWCSKKHARRSELKRNSVLRIDQNELEPFYIWENIFMELNCGTIYAAPPMVVITFRVFAFLFYCSLSIY